MKNSRNSGLIPLSAGNGLPALMRQTGKEGRIVNNKSDFEKRIGIELVQGSHSIEELIKNDAVFKEIDGRYYVSIGNAEDLFQLYEKIYQFIGFIHGLILQKDDEHGYHLFIYDDWIE